MLIEFKVSNYRSIGEEQILSMIPAPKQKDYLENIFSADGYESLNAIAIYGANGSGKSNLLSAMGVLNSLIHLSSRFSSITKLPYDPFLLREGWTEKPTSFEITFILSGHRYRYGVQFNQDTIEKEWLFRKSVGREVTVFLREGEVIDPTSSFKANVKVMDAAIEATKANGLFLSSCDMMNISEAVGIIQWFKRFSVVDGINSTDFEGRTMDMLEDKEFCQRIMEYMVRMGTGITGVHLQKSDDNDYLGNFGVNANHVMASHYLYDSQGKRSNDQISWKFEGKESGGTIKALHLSGPILWALKYGSVLIVDEIEAKMHPLMTLDTIKMFLDPMLNKKRAQLIFATHDTNLLSYAKLRRDQIYFAEKNLWESTEIYSLSDFVYISDIPGAASKERPDTDKEKRYFEGRYGGVPTLGKFKFLNED